jgi:tripartite motif-containing protein 71
VADTVNQRVQAFTSAGTFLGKFGSAGSGNGQFSGPQGVAVNSSGDVYVVDDGNSRVEKWIPAG